MPTINLSVGWDVRDICKRLPNISLQANVSAAYWTDTTDGMVTRSEKKQINEPDWSYQYNTGISSHFKRHNGFRDQERYQRVSRNFVIREGTFVKYYTSSYEPYSSDPLYHEDNNREIERYFDVPLIVSFQPENEIYNRFGIQHLDEFEVHLHMALFLELNYANLRKIGIEPACPTSEHNPVWWQRGYESFRYHGYSFQQIAPKAGDMMKLEAFNTLYEIESVKDAAPEYQHRWRKYWWKLFLRAAVDDGRSVSDEVLNDPEQEGFINNLLGTQAGQIGDGSNSGGSGSGEDGNGGDVVGGTGGGADSVPTWPFDVSCVVNELKKDVLFHPIEVPPEVEDVSCHPNWYPCGDKFGQW